MGLEVLDKVQEELALQYLTKLVAFFSNFLQTYRVFNTQTTALSPISAMPGNKDST
jgi:hypothetical protein